MVMMVILLYSVVAIGIECYQSAGENCYKKLFPKDFDFVKSKEDWVL